MPTRNEWKKNPAMELMIMVLLHKTDDSEWTEEELSPIKELENHGGYIFIFSHGSNHYLAQRR